MLAFLRKYQKIIFVVVTVMVIASFSFFGVYSAFDERSRSVDYEMGKGINGSPMKHSEIAHLVAILETDAQDVAIYEGEMRVNLLNDGIMKEEILASGIGRILFDGYAEELQGEMKKKVEKFRAFVPYTHPGRLLSVEGIWKQFMPQIWEDFCHFKQVAQNEEVTGEVFDALVALYRDQCTFTPAMMRQILRYQEQQYSQWIPADPYLQRGELALFYAKGVSDWFGRKFTTLVAEFIHNAALYAEEQGYQVSYEEAKGSLMQIGLTNLKKLDENKTLDRNEFQRFYLGQIHALGMSEEEAVQAWKKVLLFRKLVQDVASGITMDTKLYRDFHNWASKGVKLEVYQFPKEFQFTTLDDVLKFQIYLDAISREKGSFLLPREIKSVEEIAQSTPELVQKRFLLRLAKMDKEALIKDIALRKTWDWEVEEGNWKKLQQEFPELSRSHAKDREGRFTALEGLDMKVREKIDHFAKERILEKNPELLREKLSKIRAKLETLAIPLRYHGEILEGISDAKGLFDLLDKASEEKEVGETISCYTQDHKRYYRIRIKDKSPELEVLTFREAREKGVLDYLLDQKLHQVYEKEGYTKEFDEVRDAVVQKAFAPLLAHFEGDEGAKNFRLKEELQTQMALLIAGQTIPKKGVKEKGDDNHLGGKENILEQWLPESYEVTVMRKQKNATFPESVYAMKEGELSEISLINGALGFYRAIDSVTDPDEPYKSIEEGQKILGKEARRHLVKKLLEEIKAHHAIVFEKQDGS